MQVVGRAMVAMMLMGAAAAPACGVAQMSVAPIKSVQNMQGPLVEGKRALAAKQFVEAKKIFAAFLQEHHDSVDAQLGLADAELGLHEYESAELAYRRVVSAQPEQWNAHKNLVIVEAALDRWEEFDRERAVLRGARERGEAGISARESDVIDSFIVQGQHWVVREYFEPVGRSLTRYNFEHFLPDGKAAEYISLESAEAAQKALKPGDVRIGADSGTRLDVKDFALNWYTSKGHGTVGRYASGEPSYERVRRDVLRWLRAQAVGHPS
jgi:tetratricopeptide (TPR) repeat protein